jgi:glycosyltransferase involved in cell wall biosynthesis
MVIIHVVEPFASGVAVFVQSLVENLPNDEHYIIHGERTEVMPAASVKALFPQNNVHFISWKHAHRSINPIKDLRALLFLVGELKKLKKVDAVHLHSSKSGFLGRIACKLVGLKNVVYTPNGAPFLNNGRGKNFLFKKLEQLGAALGGRVICCSKSEQEAYLRIGIKAGYVNNGTALMSIDLSKSNHQERFIIVKSSRIEKQKNPALFNEIASYFLPFPQFEFIWIGDGTQKEALSSPNIKITGWLPEWEAKKIVAQADLFLSTSAFEGLSFSTLEAMQLRKPLLLSDCVGNRDMIANGLNGDLFSNTQSAILKILEYYNNKAMLPLMGHFSQNLCEKEFDVKRNLPQYRRIYTKFGAPEQQNTDAAADLHVTLGVTDKTSKPLSNLPSFEIV